MKPSPSHSGKRPMLRSGVRATVRQGGNNSGGCRGSASLRRTKKWATTNGPPSRTNRFASLAPISRRKPPVAILTERFCEVIEIK
jgi:hypothetical protein